MQGNREQSGGPGATAPNTPRKGGAALNKLIRSLEDEFQLGLEIHNELLSPSQRADTLAGKVHLQIQCLYYKSEAALDEALEGFRRFAQGFEHAKRLELLHGVLRSQTRSPLSRTGTPLSSQGRHGNVPPKPWKFSGPEPSRVPRSPGLFQTYRNDDPEAYYTTAPEPGSPTDVDEDDDEDEFFTPPSPTLSSQSAQRRVQPGDISSDVGPSTTFASTNLFKKPSLDMVRSFQAASMRTSANTSFSTIFSSQQTEPDTATTSFTSDAYNTDVNYPKLTRTSSSTIGSFDEQCLVSVSAKLEKETAELEMARSQASQDSTRESSSTFGSIDEGGLLETSFHVEAELAVPRIPPLLNTGLSHSRIPATSLSSANSQQPPYALDPRTSLPPPSTPTKHNGESLRTPSTTKSPSKLAYYIRDIPEQNLFTEQLSDELKRYPYFILFICCRVAREVGISMRELMRGMCVDQQAHPTTFWETLSDHPQVGNTVKRPEQSKVWSSAKRDFDGYTFKGRLLFRTQSAGPVFDLELLPIQADKSGRLQRKFGSHRFLYLNIPSFDTAGKTRPPRFTGDQMKQIKEQWKAWLQKEHCFLGRKWRAFHKESIKRKAGRLRDDNSDERIIMFATEGVGIEDTSIGEMLDWFIPLAGNMDQNFCKAYARLDLGLSRTIPTLVFKPSQIRRVDDIKADGTPEDTRFNDPNLEWNERPEPDAVMNDGCSRMSVGAALAIWSLYSKATDSKEPIPSIFQGRIGGAKGIWMVCGEPSTSDPAELDIWIEIADSQLKFEFHEEDLDDLGFDAHRLTFEHVSHSSRPGASELHISFIPILVDRGVPQQAIASLIINRLNVEREELLQMLPDHAKLYHWLHRLSQSITDENQPWQGAMPQSFPNKIGHLLESGFYPQDEPYLANIIYRYIKQNQIWMEQKLRVPLGKATILYGVADPLGVLAPGEVHIDFSTPFVDAVTGGTYRALNNMDLLVARQPACRRSDIQKVRAVKRPELSAQVDVIVFSSRGEYPLAGKLQGGDYDGDTFWLCWEPDLIHPFRNAPAPLTALNPEQYGIKKDTRKLCEVMRPGELSTVDNLLKEVFDFRLAPSLLGVVTNFLEKQAYKENNLYSERLNALCDVHDLLVDAPKQGYLFSQADYDNFIRCELRCGNPKKPAYKQAMEDCEGAKELGEVEKAREKDYKHKQDNVLDYLYFEVVRKHDVETLKSVKNILSKEVSDDPALQYPYINLRANSSDVVKAELAALVESLKEIDQLWIKKVKSKSTLTSGLFNETVETCYRRYRDLMPSQIDHQDIKPLLYPYLSFDFSVWQSIRASALYTELPKRHAFVWHMAGRELAKLKCAPLPGAKLVTGSIFANLRPRPIKVPKPEEEESEEEFESAMEHFSA